MRSPYMLNSGWWEPTIKGYLVPNLIAEAARDLGATDDRVRLAIAHAGMLEGKKVGRWDVCVAIASQAGKLNQAKLLTRAKSKAIADKVKKTSAEFDSFQVNQRPTFLIEDDIGDRAVLSGLVRLEPLAATIDAMLADAAAYTSWKAHFGGPPA
jgi:predicted DsbA family dithiol-disulfide isomerase